VHRQDKSFGLGNSFSNVAYDLHSIQFGHADIDYGYVRFEFYSLFHRLTAIRRLGDDSPALLGLEELQCTTPHQPVVVSDQNA
jgi:hypothetical protein